MKRKHFWKFEYSMTVFVVFAVVLLLIPHNFIASKEAAYISGWNDTFHKMDYIFTAMNAQADSNIVKSLKSAQTNSRREQIMMNLVRPYLRITEKDVVGGRYVPSYMNGKKINKNDEYYFDKYYMTKAGKIVGIKDIKDDDVFHPAFIMMFDMNGLSGPNVWGKDIFGMNIFADGNINPLGSGHDVEALKSDCSEKGTGVFCSYYYRIGGDFKE